MSTKSDIEWTDATWNSVIGCAKVSAGCKHCYAETMAARQVLMSRAQGRTSPYLPVVDVHERVNPQTKKAEWVRRWNGRAVCLPERLGEPLRWKKPAQVFVNSMSDLFHEDVPFEFVAAVFGVMAATRHTYQVLTKRPERMLEFFAWLDGQVGGVADGCVRRCLVELDQAIDRPFHLDYPCWPLPNVWLGVSAEDQATADERIPLLLRAPAAVRFVSAEPLLGPIILREEWLLGNFLSCFDETDDPETDNCQGCEAVPSSRRLGGPREGDFCGAVRGPALSWVIAGGESGPGARLCDTDWLRSLLEQCDRARVACFVKQLGSRSTFRPCDAKGNALTLRDRKGGDPDEWPAGLRVRQLPEARHAG